MSSYVLIPMLGAFIGWVTNHLAIKMLFYPRQPVAIPLTKWRIQGLLPSRRDQLAEAISEVVSSELIQVESLGEKLATPRLKAEVVKHIMTAIHNRVDAALPAFIPRGLVGAMVSGMHETVKKEVDHFFGEPFKAMLGSEETKKGVRAAVKERLDALPLEELEALLLHLAKTEVRHIEISGALLGFLIGLIQALIKQG